MVRLFVVITLFSGLPSMAPAQESPRAPGSLMLEEVVRLAKAGLSDELIVARVKRNNKPFDLNTDEILELKNSGVNDIVIKYLLDPSLPYAPPPVPQAFGAAVKAQAPPAVIEQLGDPFSMKVPPEPGGYWMRSPELFVKLDLKPVVPDKQDGRLVSVLTGGLKKGHNIGALIGASAKTRIPRGGEIVIYFRFAEKLSIEDLVLISVVPGDGRRQIDFGSKSDKPGFFVESVRQFESTEASAGLFRLSMADTPSGEYVFFILGSGDEKKGLLGKGYEFGVY